ncbi:hypothetical protein APR42_08435 [Salegentibacter mishustinae]|uniref:Uncharacterized protein n=1 Tax=Salegentibacter mishustinae TaxID=270918 RepID=A0A0Q9Z4H8_9FLAO|nr:hypothetical protein APR42_08435 [Salegentibacter mishustinae]PNW20842.1 hypothetical protein APB85_06060 [Salegentibacter mishustinae]
MYLFRLFGRKIKLMLNQKVTLKVLFVSLSVILGFLYLQKMVFAYICSSDSRFGGNSLEQF